MKNQIVPVVALAIAASVSAEDAKQELSYNRIILSQVTDSNSAGYHSVTGFSVEAQAKLGKGFYVHAGTINWGSNDNQDIAMLGYAYTLPSLGSVTADLNVEAGAYGRYLVGVRGYVATNLELGVAYWRENSSGQAAMHYSLAYNLDSLTKGLSLNVNYENGRDNLTDITFIGLGYNF